MFLLFEDQSKPIGSPERYYVNIHIGAGMKTRQGAYEMERNLMLMSQEKHSSSFVKRLPNPYASNFKRVSYSAPANLKHLETFQRGQLFGLSDQSLLTLGEPGTGRVCTACTMGIIIQWVTVNSTYVIVHSSNSTSKGTTCGCAV